MPGNPFRFGDPDARPLLIGREREVDEIARTFHEGKNLNLVAPRGAGKTSLLRAAEGRAQEEGLQTVYVDLFPAISTRRFAEIYASALTLEPTSTVESMQEALQQLVPTIVPRLTITGSGRPGLQLDLWDRDRDIRALLDRILDAPGQMASGSDLPLVVVFDDFEDLISLGAEDLLQPLGQAIRRHRNVCYTFVLRKESTAARTFGEAKSPFYRMADPVRLDSVPPDLMAEGLQAQFEAAGVVPEEGVLRRLVEFAADVPHSIQVLAHTLFEDARDHGKATDADLRHALSHVLELGAYASKSRWDQLALHQRNLVLAIAQGYTERLHSQRMVFQLGLGSPSTVSKNLRTLEEREILQRRDGNIRFVDPFFGLWLQRRMT